MKNFNLVRDCIDDIDKMSAMLKLQIQTRTDGKDDDVIDILFNKIITCSQRALNRYEK